MARILSFGDYGEKKNPLKEVYSEIKSLSLFTKMTIIVVILLPLVVLRASGEILQFFNYAAPSTTDVSAGLPPNCHFAVDLTQCGKDPNCQPKPKIVCEDQK